MSENEKEKIINALKEIIDPEIGFDIVSLGEVEEVKIDGKKVFIKFLPTTPMCPYLPFLLEAINAKIKELGYEVDVEIDFENQWSPERIDPEVRKKLGI